jgi:hypothetical protein
VHLRRTGKEGATAETILFDYFNPPWTCYCRACANRDSSASLKYSKILYVFESYPVFLTHVRLKVKGTDQISADILPDTCFQDLLSREESQQCLIGSQHIKSRPRANSQANRIAMRITMVE